MQRRRPRSPSPAQIQANRANAKKSSGPRSAAGKAASSRNGLTHGLSAKKHILTGKDTAEFDALLQDLYARFLPVGPGEEDLVYLIAADQSRLVRAIPLEAGILTECLNAVDASDLKRLRRQPAQNPPDPAYRLARAFAFDAGHQNRLAKLNRYESALQRSIDRRLRQLKIYQQARQATPTVNCKANPILPPTRSFPAPSAHQSDRRANPVGRNLSRAALTSRPGRPHLPKTDQGP